MFREICKFIETETGFVMGKTLQVGHRLQSAPDRHILVSESGGGDPNPYSPDMMNVNIQIISRGKTYFEAEEDIFYVYRMLHATFGWVLMNVDGVAPDYLVNVIEAIQTPYYLGEDENRRHEFTCNFIFKLEEAVCGGATPSPPPTP